MICQGLWVVVYLEYEELAKKNTSNKPGGSLIKPLIEYMMARFECWDVMREAFSFRLGQMIPIDDIKVGGPSDER